MNQPQMLGIVAAIMVLTIMVGGLVRGRMRGGEGLRLAVIWAAIIAAAALIAAVGQKLIH